MVSPFFQLLSFSKTRTCDSGLLTGDVHPGVNVRRAAEVPDHSRSLDHPAVPDLVVTDIPLVKVGDRQCVESAVGVDALERLVDIALAVHVQHAAQGLVEKLLLILRHVRSTEAFQLALGSLEPNHLGTIGRRLDHQGLVTLLAIEGGVELVGQARLVPPDVAGMIRLLIETLSLIHI